MGQSVIFFGVYLLC